MRDLLNPAKSMAVRLHSNYYISNDEPKKPQYELELYNPIGHYVVTHFNSNDPQDSREDQVIQAFESTDFDLIMVTDKEAKNLIGSAACQFHIFRGNLRLVRIS